MPDRRRSDPLEPVQHHLPSQAQDKSKEAINSAFEQDDHEQNRAHAVAWAAVKRRYHKGEDGGRHEGPSDD